MKYLIFIVVGFFMVCQAFAENKVLFDANYNDGILKIFEENNKTLVEFCFAGKCDLVKSELGDSEYVEFSSFGSEDVDGDHVPEVFISSKGMVNSCSEFYRFDRASLSLSLLKINGVSLRLCNRERHKDFIVSTFRTGPQWDEEIYQIGTGIVFIFRDVCTGCDFVKRVHADGRVEMVSSGESFLERKRLQAKVVAEKAFLYSAPNSLTKMYLVKGDVAEVVDYKYGDVEWFKCVYTTAGGKKIEKWVSGSDVEISYMQ